MLTCITQFDNGTNIVVGAYGNIITDGPNDNLLSGRPDDDIVNGDAGDIYTLIVNPSPPPTKKAPFF